MIKDSPYLESGGFDSGSNAQREGMLSFKQFVLGLEDDISPADAGHRYTEYKSEYISTQKRAYFESHKHEDWLKDKYHPTNLVTVIERRNKQARTDAMLFFHDLQKRVLDLTPGQRTSPKSECSMNPEKENDSQRIQKDIKQAQALVCKLDAEKDIGVNVLSEVLEGVELLDALISYLWCIHGIDYYGMNETNEPKGLPQGRADSKLNDWEKKLDSFWQERLCGHDPLGEKIPHEMTDKISAKFLQTYVTIERIKELGLLYRCRANGCIKVFIAAEFVHMHMRKKHSDLVSQITIELHDDLYFQNYMKDANAPGGTPVMQKSAPKDKVSRQWSVGNRLRDERPSLRVHERTNEGIEEDRYGRTDNSPSIRDEAY